MGGPRIYGAQDCFCFLSSGLWDLGRKSLEISENLWTVLLYIGSRIEHDFVKQCFSRSGVWPKSTRMAAMGKCSIQDFINPTSERAFGFNIARRSNEDA